MRQLSMQTNFTGGEIDPRLFAQIDLARYKNGLRQARNAICQPHGPVSRRNGTRFIAETKDSTKMSRLLRFQFSQDAAYVLEFGHLYIRFYKEQAQIMSGMTPYEIVSPYTETDLEGLSLVQFGNTIFLAHFNHAPMRLRWRGDTDWMLSAITFDPPATYEGGHTTNTTVTPSATTGNITLTTGASFWLEGDVGRIVSVPGGTASAEITSLTSTTVVNATVISAFPNTSAIAAGDWIVEGSPVANIQVRRLTSGSTAKVYAFSPDLDGDSKPGATLVLGGYTGSGVNIGTAPITGTFKATDVGRRIFNLTGSGIALITAFVSTATVTVTFEEDWQNTNDVASQGWAIRTKKEVFHTTDVGKYILAHDGYVRITTVTAPDLIEGEVVDPVTSRELTLAWTLESDSWTSDNGYPRSIALHQQRLCFASTEMFPQTVWMSSVGLFDSQAIGSESSDAISIDLSTAEVNQAQWMASLDELAMGTVGAELVISSGTNNIVLTPSTVAQKTQGYSGSILQIPVLLEGEVLYIQRSRRKLNSFRYNVNANQMVSETLSFLAEHLTEGLLKEVIVARDPSPVIYAVLQDGTMAVCSYVRSENVIAWSLFSTEGSYESVQSVSNGSRDEVWVVVNRTINGVTKRYVEFFDYGNGEDNIDGFSDCYLSYSQPKTITAMTKASPGVFTSTSHGFTDGDDIKIFGSGIEAIDGKTMIVDNSTPNTFTLIKNGVPLDTTGFADIASGAEAHELVETISGLSHLEGMTVQVKIDGAPSADKVVSGGSITLDVSAYEVTVGLTFVSTIETLDLVYQQQIGLQQAQPVRFSRPVLRLRKSFNPIVNGEYVPARNPSMRMDNKVPLFTGDLVYGGLTYDQTGRLLITTDRPLPLNILGIFSTADAGTK